MPKYTVWIKYDGKPTAVALDVDASEAYEAKEKALDLHGRDGMIGTSTIKHDETQ